MGARFRELMSGPEPLICANAYDLLTAHLIEVHGFEGVFVGSSATNLELLALADQAIVTVSEIIEYDSVIAANVDISVVADVDDFGATTSARHEGLNGILKTALRAIPQIPMSERCVFACRPDVDSVDHDRPRRQENGLDSDVDSGPRTCGDWRRGHCAGRFPFEGGAHLRAIPAGRCCRYCRAHARR
jgi:hypothetical protein